MSPTTRINSGDSVAVIHAQAPAKRACLFGQGCDRVLVTVFGQLH